MTLVRWRWCGIAALLAALAGEAGADPSVFVVDDFATVGQLSIVDPVAGTVVARVTVPDTALGVALRPDRTLAYVASSGNQTSLTVVDVAGRSVVTTTPLGQPDCGPPDVAVDAAGSRVFVAGGPAGQLLAILDAATGALLQTVPAPGGGASGAPECTSGLAVSPTSGVVYAIGTFQDVWMIDPATGNATRIDVGTDLQGTIAVSPDGKHVYAPASTETSPAGEIVAFDADGTVQPRIMLNGAQPDHLIVLPGGDLYVSAFDVVKSLPEIVRVSPATGLVAGTIAVAAPPRGLASSADGSRVFVALTDGTSGTIAAVDPATDTVVGTGIPVDTSPRAVAVLADPCAGLPASACDDGNPCTTDVCASGACRHDLVRDGTPCDPCDATRTCTAGVCTATPFACTPSAAVAYVAAFASGQVAVVDLATGQTTDIPVAAGPWGAAAADRGGRAFVTNRRGRSLSIIDGTTRTMAASVALGGTPLGVAADPQSGLAYVANYARDRIELIDPVDATVVATIAVGHGPVALAAHPAGDRLYVSNYLGNTVSVVDVATRRVVDTVAVGDGPLGIAVHPDGTRVYVAHYREGTIGVLGTAADHPLREIRVGRKPFAVAIDPAGTAVYVTSLGGGTVSVIDPGTEAVVAQLTVGAFPFGLSIDPVSHRLGLVAGGPSGAFSILDPSTGAPMASAAVGAVPVSLGQFIGDLPGDCPPKPLACDDQDPFTQDTCTATGCRHASLPADDAAPAGAGAVADALEAARPGTLGPDEQLEQLRQLVAAVVASVPAPPAPVTPAALREARGRVRALVKALVRAARRPDVRPEVVDRLLDLARGTARVLHRLRRRA